jgi:glyoxylase-like metal-dependent hydrolase (beta-lactamase superfamily II)
MLPVRLGSTRTREHGMASTEEKAPGDADLHIGPVHVLVGHRGGRYPDGNSMLVKGNEATAIVDPALGLWTRRDTLPHVDLILGSHCHEDHIAAYPLFPDATPHLHAADAVGLADLEGMLGIYGFEGPTRDGFARALIDQFHYEPRAEIELLEEGDVLDLGGVEIDVLHTPGHTRGHCCFLVRWPDEGRERRLLYLGDIELTSFGPYYGDAWSDLGDFERSLARVREIEADWYATFHHIGVLEGRGAFLERLDLFEAKIADREERLLAYLAEPRSMDDITAHRFVYRPGDDVPWADSTERRSAEQHIARWVERGVVKALGDGRWQRADREDARERLSR